MQKLSTDELRKLWQKGMASGPARFTSIEAIKEEARRRFVVDNLTFDIKSK